MTRQRKVCWKTLMRIWGIPILKYRWKFTFSSMYIQSECAPVLSSYSYFLIRYVINPLFVCVPVLSGYCTNMILAIYVCRLNICILFSICPVCCCWGIKAFYSNIPGIFWWKDCKWYYFKICGTSRWPKCGCKTRSAAGPWNITIQILDVEMDDCHE